MNRYLLSTILLLCSAPWQPTSLHATEPEHEPSIGELLSKLSGESSKIDRCGTSSVDATARSSIRAGLAELQSSTGPAAAPAGPIPVVYHVIQEGAELEQGNIPDSWVHSQHQILNDAFATTGISFSFVSITRTWHPKWYRRCSKRGWEKKIERTLAVDPASTLNIYICDTGQYLGWSSLPWEHEEDSEAHSVFIWSFALPNHEYGAPFDEGDVAVHEVGHYLGLYHTFEGGCDEPGDEVDDTPAEAFPNYGCPDLGRDTCPGPGFDPINNYMNFTDDYCMDEFTAGQGDRMMEMIEVFRPSL